MLRLQFVEHVEIRRQALRCLSILCGSVATDLEVLYRTGSERDDGINSALERR
jgi:hypothetical protein